MATVKYNLGTVGGMAVTELWSGSAGSLVGEDIGITVTLNDDITNYKFLIFDFYCALGGNNSIRYYSRVIPVQQFINLINGTNTNTLVSFCWGYSNVDDYFEFNKVSTTRVLNASCRYSRCTRILGIN